MLVTKEKLSSEKCSVGRRSWLCVVGNRRRGTAPGTCPEGLLLLDAKAGRAEVKAQHDLGLVAPAQSPPVLFLALPCSSLSSFLEAGAVLLVCPAGDGVGTAAPAHAKWPWLPQT